MVINLKTVIDNINEIIINKSRFITFVYKIDNIECVNEKLNKIKEEYKDATHYCYAYIVDNQEKACDDGEPSGTAGVPILNVLQKENVNNVLCVVVRYFGGIKLGAGGLVRAYSKACKSCLKTKVLNNGYLIEICFNYDDIKQIDYLLKNSHIINKDFKDKIYYKFLIKENEYNNIIDKIKNISEIININKTKF